MNYKVYIKTVTDMHLVYYKSTDDAMCGTPDIHMIAKMVWGHINDDGLPIILDSEHEKWIHPRNPDCYMIFNPDNIVSLTIYSVSEDNEAPRW